MADDVNNDVASTNNDMASIDDDVAVDTCHSFLVFSVVQWGCFRVPCGTTHRVTCGSDDVRRLSTINDRWFLVLGLSAIAM